MKKSIRNLSTVTTIGLDIAKNVFQVHGVDAAGFVVVAKSVRRAQLLAGEHDRERHRAARCVYRLLREIDKRWGDTGCRRFLRNLASPCKIRHRQGIRDAPGGGALQSAAGENIKVNAGNWISIGPPIIRTSFLPGEFNNAGQRNGNR